MSAALWGLFLMGMYHWDKLKFFQAWPYFYFSGAAGVVLLVLAAKSALWPSAASCRGEPHHGKDESCEPASSDAHGEPPPARETKRGMWPVVKGIALMALVMLPVIAGLLIPHRSLNALAAMRRGMGLDSANLLDVYRSDRRRWAEAAKDYQLWTTLEVLEIGRDRPGMKVRTIGFIYRSDEMPTDIMTVARFKITCCAADATPIGVAVRWPEAKNFSNDTWVEVRGTVERQEIEGRPTTVIVAEEVREIAPPDQPYI